MSSLGQGIRIAVRALAKAPAFESFGGFEQGSAQWPLTSDGEPLQVDVALLTRSAFEVIGIQPARGRLPASWCGASSSCARSILASTPTRTSPVVALRAD